MRILSSSKGSTQYFCNISVVITFKIYPRTKINRQKHSSSNPDRHAKTC